MDIRAEPELGAVVSQVYLCCTKADNVQGTAVRIAIYNFKPFILAVSRINRRKIFPTRSGISDASVS